SAWPTTDTDSVTPTSSFTLSWMGTADRTSMSRSTDLNPCASMVRWYGFGGTLRKTYFPPASVLAGRVKPDTRLLTSTATACIAPPVGSVTLPGTVPAPPSSCAASERAATPNSIRIKSRLHPRMRPSLEIGRRPVHSSEATTLGDGPRPKHHNWLV